MEGNWSKVVIYGHYYCTSKVDGVSTDSENIVAGLAVSETLCGTKCNAWNLVGAIVSVVSRFESWVLCLDPGRSHRISFLLSSL